MIPAFHQPVRNLLLSQRPLHKLFSVSRQVDADRFSKTRTFSDACALPNPDRVEPNGPSLSHPQLANHLNPFRRTLSPETPYQPWPIYPATPLAQVWPRYKLMSYNAENFVKTNRGKMVKSPSSIQALGKAILLEDPDVIALQEVGDHKLLAQFNQKYLRNQYPHIVCPPTVGPSELRVAMLSKAHIKVIDHKSHLKEMSEGANYKHKRDLLEATFQTDSGFRFTVYNAHCKSMVGGEERTAPVRMQEVRNLSRILKNQLGQHPDAPVFVAGDFNLRHDTSHGKPILETLIHLDDPTQPPMLTEVMMKDGKAEPTHNGNDYYPNHKLDYIFVSNTMIPQIKQAYVAGNFAKAPWRNASDHLPYVTEFEELPQAIPLRNNIIPLSISPPNPITPLEHYMTQRKKRRRLHLNA